MIDSEILEIYKLSNVFDKSIKNENIKWMLWLCFFKVKKRLKVE